MAEENEQLSFTEEQSEADNEPVVCLGMTFKNHDERREYFRNELRKKLPELKEIEGFPIGEDEDIIALSDPPYYSACPNPWINDFLDEWEREKIKRYGKSTVKKEHNEPYATDITEGRSDAIYNAHSYHTKVPPKAIMRYILHYTNPGDVVFDGFSGTGMTGVAAELCAFKEEVEDLGYKVDNDGIIYRKEEIGDEKEWIAFSRIGQRKAILNDLSPIASHIAYNYNNGIGISNLEESALGTIRQYEDKYAWLYYTLREEYKNKEVELVREIENITDLNKLSEWFSNNKKYFVKANYYVWTDEILCPNCSESMKLWEMTLEKGVNDGFSCPKCHKKLKKKTVDTLKNSIYDPFLDKVIEKTNKVPALINYKVGSKRFTKKPSEFDYKLIDKVEHIMTKTKLFVPINRMPDGDEARRNDKTGIKYIHQFYTKRNLMVLALLWKESESNRILKLSLTSILLKTASLLHNIGLKKGKINLAGALPNSLYIPGNIAERNIFELLRGKLKDIVNAELNKRNESNVVSCMSLGYDYKRLNPTNKLDYIFIDPPFGSNLMYSELNFIWESWIRIFTNNKSETIVNNTQRKNIDNYRELMLGAFKSCYDMLKPGGWMTVEFSNTQASVWNSIQTAIQEAGFMVADVAALNKGQGTYNSQTNPTSVTQDLVISAHKPEKNIINELQYTENEEETVWNFVTSYLEILTPFRGKKGVSEVITERTPRVIYDRLVAYYIQNGQRVPMSSSDFQKGLNQRFPIRDGMAFLESQVAEYDKKRTLVKEFAQQSLFVSDENSAIEWIRQQLMNKPQSRQDIHPDFMKEIQHIAKHELLPELDDLLYQNFLVYEGVGPAPDQIVSYLRRNYKDLRGLDPEDPKVVEKAKNRWYVPDPTKQADLEKLREKSLLREFDDYLKQLEGNKRKLKQFRTEAIRAGFKKAYSDKDFERIVKVGERLPEKVIQEDDKLLMYYDNACIRLGL